MDLIPLDFDYEIKPFDCGDPDLNDFLANDAKKFLEKRLGRTFLLLDNDSIVAYFCLFNDKLSRQDVTGASWRRLKKLFPHKKHFSSYPAIKIGRFAVAKQYMHSGIGRELMTAVKFLLDKDSTYSIFRFLTVDAYISAVPFYEKNDFSLLQPSDEDRHTRLMYFDMTRM